MEIRGYINFLRRRWWLLLIGPTLACISAYFVSMQITPAYRATAELLVVNQTTYQLTELNGLQVDERLTNTYVKLIERRDVLQAVIDRLELNLLVEDLARQISVSAIEETQLITVSVEHLDPDQAALIANATAEEFVTDINQQVGAGGGEVSISEQAVAPNDPFKPNLKTNLMLAGVLGLLVAGGLAIALEYLDDTIKTPEDFEPLGLTAIGKISRFKRSPFTNDAEEALDSSEFHSRYAEAYRQLRTNIHFTNLDAALKTIVVTSANPGEGKSTTASNLATVLAQAGDRVILVDADLRRSSLRQKFDSSKSFGLTGLLYNDVGDPSVALVRTRWKNLKLLPAGALPPNPSELLTSARMGRVIEGLRGLADYVIFDTPPILAVTDAVVLSARTDGTILVAEVGRTRSEALRQAVQALTQANARIAGAVLNKAKADASGYYYREKEIEVPVEVEVGAGLRSDGRGMGRAQIPNYVVKADKDEVRERKAPAKPDLANTTSPGDGTLPARTTAQEGTAVPVSRSAPARSAPPRSETTQALARLRSQIEASLPSNGGRAGAGSGDEARITVPSSNANGNGRLNGSTPANGNGHKPSPQQERSPLGEAVSDLLGHLDETVGLISALKPESEPKEARNL